MMRSEYSTTPELFGQGELVPQTLVNHTARNDAHAASEQAGRGGRLSATERRFVIAAPASRNTNVCITNTGPTKAANLAPT